MARILTELRNKEIFTRDLTPELMSTHLDNNSPHKKAEASHTTIQPQVQQSQMTAADFIRMDEKQQQILVNSMATNYVKHDPSLNYKEAQKMAEHALLNPHEQLYQANAAEHTRG